MKNILATAILLAVSIPFAARAADPVLVEGPHNCCPTCLKTITKVLENVRDVTVDQKKKTITAKSKSDAKKAVDKLMDAGFFATIDGVKPGEAPSAAASKSGATAAKKVKSATVTGVHNCCLKCRNMIWDACKEVPGVTQVEIEPESPAFTVAGEFTREDLLASLNKAGFNGKIK